MIEFDTQIIPTARAMSFLFFWARSAFKVRKEFYVTAPSFRKVATRYLLLFGCVGVLRKRSNSDTPAVRRCVGRRS